MNAGVREPKVAVVIRGPARDATTTVRSVKSIPAGIPFEIYLVLDPSDPAEALNRTAAVRTEDLILFLDAGLTPIAPNWLLRMVDAIWPDGIAAALGQRTEESEGAFAGLLTRRDIFDLLGGFDADRYATSGYQDDYLTRMIGMGFECVAPTDVLFLAGAQQLKRAG
jgi:O-antigen biosynthesis protein